ncbi:uncharacterized protein LOC121430198 [Lytechinus variegatus]|uniref:uncharacterized protein LOC121430198 n=1 Tax=Lytechinus variegatus TaxID=7654 RepID=UPI001BB2D037|nr:uncharacterized protein LOC121430198 [Lytechinus variegatus]
MAPVTSKRDLEMIWCASKAGSAMGPIRCLEKTKKGHCCQRKVVQEAFVHNTIPPVSTPEAASQMRGIDALKRQKNYQCSRKAVQEDLCTQRCTRCKHRTCHKSGICGQHHKALNDGVSIHNPLIQMNLTCMIYFSI